MSDFIQRRLNQLEPKGAILGAVVDRLHVVYVSTVDLGSQRWTRAETPDQKIREHYEGAVVANTAAERFVRAHEAELLERIGMIHSSN